MKPMLKQIFESAVWAFVGIIVVLAAVCIAWIISTAILNVKSFASEKRKKANASKEKPVFCPRCTLSDLPRGMQAAHSFAIVEDGLYYYDSELGWEGEKINYCPWCGRALK